MAPRTHLGPVTYLKSADRTLRGENGGSRLVITKMTPEETAAEADAAEAEALRVPSTSAWEAIEHPQPKTEGLCGGWLVPGEGMAPIARGGVGKTTWTRNFLLHSANGVGGYCGREFHHGPVHWAYFTREGAGSWWVESLQRTAAGLGYGRDVLERIELIEQANDCGLYLPDDADAIERKLGELKERPGGLDAFALDPWSGFTRGSDQDDEKVAASWDAALGICKRLQLAVLTPHHASQNGHGLDAARGSTKFEEKAATILLLTDGVKASDGTKEPETVRELRVFKSRHDRRKTKHYFDFNEDTEVYSERAAPGAAAAVSVVLFADPGHWYTVKDLAKKAKVGEQTVRDLLNRGAVNFEERPGKGRSTEYRGGSGHLGI